MVLFCAPIKRDSLFRFSFSYPDLLMRNLTILPLEVSIRFIIIILLFWGLFTPVLADGFALHSSLSDSKFPQVSRTLLSILADLNITVIWMVSTHPLIFKSSSPFTNPLVTVPSVPIITGITIIFSSLPRSKYLSLFLLSFSFTQ